MNASHNLIYEFGPFLLEPHARRLSRHGQPVPLGAPEFELLLLLCATAVELVDKREIMKAVWPDVDVEANNRTVRMSALRRALGETKENHPYIKTVTGRGYCLTAEVKELSAQAIIDTAATSETLRGSDCEPNSNEEQSPLSGSDPASQPGDSLPLNGSRRKWEIRHFTLYAILVGLLAHLIALRAAAAKGGRARGPGSVDEDKPSHANRSCAGGGSSTGRTEHRLCRARRRVV